MNDINWLILLYTFGPVHAEQFQYVAPQRKKKAIHVSFVNKTKISLSIKGKKGKRLKHCILE